VVYLLTLSNAIALNSLFFFSRGLGWRMHLSVEVTELSTNKQHRLSLEGGSQAALKNGLYN